MPPTSPPRVREVLEQAVVDLGGSERPGQVRMAEAVATAFDEGRHLLVQAGTGTGKSLAYLVPAAVRAAGDGAADGPVIGFVCGED